MIRLENLLIILVILQYNHATPQEINTVCPSNEVFRPCGSPCQRTCLQPLKTCIRMCVPRCECMDNYLRITEDGECIPRSDCFKLY